MTTALLVAPRRQRHAPVGGLLPEQRLAAGTPLPHVFIDAGPGTGKTAVAAERFGVLRFGADMRDGRGVVAVSFARAAAQALRSRVLTRWGTEVVTAPHRVTTLDDLIRQLLRELLVQRTVRWPGGHVELEVHDSWKSLGSNHFARAGDLRVRDGVVVAAPFLPGKVQHHIAAGVCTHEDVRSVLAQLLRDAPIRQQSCTWFGRLLRGLIVDEVFDANDLDIELIRMAVETGVPVTLVGDPWQALYEFRGARPEKMLALIDELDIPTMQLTRSFRWKTGAQRELADLLRAGRPCVLPLHCGDQPDVVLGSQWKALWQAGDDVLPLALNGYRGDVDEAVETLLLNHVTRQAFGMDAVHLRDAAGTLGIKDQGALLQIRPDLQEVKEALQAGASDVLSYERLTVAVGRIAPCAGRVQCNDADRFSMLVRRIRCPGRLVAGLTAHQAKGREWDTVGVCLSADECAMLDTGLSVRKESHRKLYVACTRARRDTVAIPISCR